MTAEGDDDRALLTRHAAGDPNAFSTLATRHRDRMWRIALRTLGDPDDAADAVQDAMVSAYRSAAGFRGESAVTTWLHRIVVNACLDLARRRAARPTIPLPDDEATPAPAPAPASSPSPSPFEASDTAYAVLAALRQLPIEQAAAVVVVDIEGFSVREAAQILDVPEGTVKSRCARARARLAGLLSDLAPGNQPPVPPVQRDVTDDGERDR
jgi:RNA polymerase sigma-70 factor (ECF subfamily)